MTSSVIALLTDFGLSDHYAAALKGVIYSIHPQAAVVDICHQVKPQNIREGGYLLKQVYSLYPKGTIFVAVVDPGVGSKRKAVCVKSHDHFFIAPDNGLLFPVFQMLKQAQVREVVNQKFFHHPVSRTFHGRDIFAPVAAHLSRGNIFARLGPKLRSIHQLAPLKLKMKRGHIEGAVEYIDHFGNVITNISKRHFEKAFPHTSQHRVQIKMKTIPFIYQYFLEAKGEKLIAVWNSSDMLEIAVPNGSAAQTYHLNISEKVVIDEA